MTEAPAPDPDASASHPLRLTAYRNVLAVVAGLTILQAAMASLALVVTISLKAAGVPNAQLGFAAASYAAGFLLGALISPREIARIGHIRAYAFFAALGAIAVLAFGFGTSVPLWCLLQMILGGCCAGLLTSGESWVADASPGHQRGAILAFYHMVSKTGAIVGPFAISIAAVGAAGFMITAALFAASLIPVAVTSKAQPQLSTATPFGPRRILKRAPAAAFSAFIAGAVNNAVAQLYPAFAADTAGEDGTGFAAQFNAALLMGAMVALWPSGLLSDRVDRRLVIAGLGFTGAVSAAGIVASAAAGPGPWILVAAFFFGAGSLSHYAVAVAHAADRSSADQATSMMAGILTIWGIGSVAGPLLAGLAMNTALEGAGLFMFAGAALGLLALSMLTRTAWQDPVAEEEKAPFGVAPATSYAIAEFDPRGQAEQLDLFLDTPEQEPA